MASLISKHNNIKVIIRQKGTINMKIPYGYNREPSGKIVVDHEKSAIVQLIYDHYLQGKSLGGIAARAKTLHKPCKTPQQLV
jgi:hypothetical protein